MNNPTIKQLLSFAKGSNLQGSQSFMLEIDRDVNGQLYFENAQYVTDFAAGGRSNVALILNRTGQFIDDQELQPIVDQAREHLLLHGGSTTIESTYRPARTPQKMKVF